MPLDATKNYCIPRWRRQKGGGDIAASDPSLRPPLAPLAPITAQETQEFLSRRQVRQTNISSGTLDRSGDLNPLSSLPVTISPQSTLTSTLEVIDVDTGLEEEPTMIPQRPATPAQSRISSATPLRTDIPVPHHSLPQSIAQYTIFIRVVNPA